MVYYTQLEAMGNLIIPLEAGFEGERFEAFREMAAAGKAHGSLMVGQVSHPGRQVESRINSDPISASNVQLEGSSFISSSCQKALTHRSRNHNGHAVHPPTCRNRTRDSNNN